jgi:hypothetical protein
MFRIWRDHQQNLKRVRWLTDHPEQATPAAVEAVIAEQRDILRRDGWELPESGR